MMSVTSLRNLKKILVQFLYEKKNQTINHIINEQYVYMDRIKDRIPIKYGLPNVVDIQVYSDGKVEVVFIPELPDVEKLIELNVKRTEIEKQFNEDVELVERYFTLAEASSILHIPEMPEKIKRWLDEMVETLK